MRIATIFWMLIYFLAMFILTIPVDMRRNDINKFDNRICNDTDINGFNITMCDCGNIIEYIVNYRAICFYIGIIITLMCILIIDTASNYNPYKTMLNAILFIYLSPLFLNGFVISIYLYKTHNCFDLISDNFTTLLVEFLIHYSINTMLIILLVYILHYIHNKKDIFDDKLVLLEHQENQEIYNLEEQKNLTNI